MKHLTQREFDFNFDSLGNISAITVLKKEGETEKEFKEYRAVFGKDVGIKNFISQMVFPMVDIELGRKWKSECILSDSALGNPKAEVEFELIDIMQRGGDSIAEIGVTEAYSHSGTISNSGDVKIENVSGGSKGNAYFNLN